MVLEQVRQIALDDLADGLVFAAAAARAEVIRDDEEYPGVRVSMTASLSQANR